MSAGGAVTVREVLALLARWQPRLLAGESGLERTVTWAGTMRARLPAFEGFTGGELTLLSLATLRLLRAQVDALTLAGLVDDLAELGAAAIAIATLEEARATGDDDAHALREARARAERHAIPLIELPPRTPLAGIEREVIAYVVAQRERPSAGVLSSPGGVNEAQVRASLRGEALEALLTGTYAGEAQMRARAAQLGYDLTQPHAILWIELMPADDGAAALPRLAREAAALAETLEVTLGAWIRARGAEVVALLPLTPERGAAEMIERAEALLTRTLGTDGPTWAAGLGEPATAPADMRRSADEARAAEQLGREVLGPRRIARPTDLGVYRLLLALRRSGELAPFVERALAPLRADRRTGDALIETLEVFFASNGNLSEAARHLHLHRNSLLYRLHRARELLDHDLDDPELRLTLQLAIRGQRVLDLG
ncbi:MAG: helix-turn-helix domain-containing protein [Ktedonobacterales bacterium]|nr:helix-turn-helix domain-containing protein [Ktedonobacterales bacterium]